MVTSSNGRESAAIGLVIFLMLMLSFGLLNAQEEDFTTADLEVIEPGNIRRISHLITLTHSDRVQHLVWSPSGGMLAVTTSHEVWLYDMSTLETPQLVADGFNIVGRVAFSSDATLLAFVTTHFTESGNYLPDPANIHIFDLLTLEPVMTLATDEFSVDIAFMEEGNNLISVDGFDYQIHVWNLISGQEISQFEPAVMGFPMMLGVEFSTSDYVYVLATGSTVNIVEGWDVVSGEKLWATPYGYPASLAVSRDGRLLYGASRYGGSGSIWDIERQMTLHSVEFVGRWASAADFTSDVGVLAQIEEHPFAKMGSRLDIRFWDVKTGETLLVTNLMTHSINNSPHFESVDLIFSPDDKLLITNDADTGLNLWGILANTN